MMTVVRDVCDAVAEGVGLRRLAVTTLADHLAEADLAEALNEAPSIESATNLLLTAAMRDMAHPRVTLERLCDLEITDVVISRRDGSRKGLDPQDRLAQSLADAAPTLVDAAALVLQAGVSRRGVRPGDIVIATRGLARSATATIRIDDGETVSLTYAGPRATPDFATVTYRTTIPAALIEAVAARLPWPWHQPPGGEVLPLAA